MSSDEQRLIQKQQEQLEIEEDCKKLEQDLDVVMKSIKEQRKIEKKKTIKSKGKIPANKEGSRMSQSNMSDQIDGKWRDPNEMSGELTENDL